MSAVLRRCVPTILSRLKPLHVLHIMEEIIEIVQVVPRHAFERLGEQVVDVPAPHVVKQSIQVPKISSHDRILRRIVALVLPS